MYLLLHKEEKSHVIRTTDVSLIQPDVVQILQP